MAEYIDREKTQAYLYNNMMWYDEEGYIAEDSEKDRALWSLVNGVPTADVIERSTMEILCNEYLSKCYLCDECCAETYCISNSLRTENRDCVNNLIAYFTKRNIGE